MKLLANVHTHSTFCDGENTPREMALAALELGFTDLGFSSHAPAPFDPTCPGIADEAAYREEIARLRDDFSGRLGILCGVESDTYAPVDASHYDYVIGSNHFLPVRNGVYCAVDADMQQLDKAVANWYGGDGLAMVKDYYTLLLQGVKLQRPSIVGHFDLVKKYNAGRRWFDENDPAYQTVALDALTKVVATVRPYGGLFEVNTGAMARGLCNEPYPGRFLLQYAARLGAKVIITSDSHRADTLNACFSQAIDMVRETGFAGVTTLRDGAFCEMVF